MEVVKSLSTVVVRKGYTLICLGIRLLGSDAIRPMAQAQLDREEPAIRYVV